MPNDPFIIDTLEKARNIFDNLGENIESKKLYARFLSISCQIIENIQDKKRVQEMLASTDTGFLELLAKEAISQIRSHKQPHDS